jgi:hypothetical protein
MKVLSVRAAIAAAASVNGANWLICRRLRRRPGPLSMMLTTCPILRELAHAGMLARVVTSGRSSW